MSEIEVTYDGPKNLVVECTQCGHEKGISVPTPFKPNPSYSTYENCGECGVWCDHEAVREAERGEFDADHICDHCDEMHSNTMDADLCCSEDGGDDSDDGTQDTSEGESRLGTSIQDDIDAFVPDEADAVLTMATRQTPSMLLTEETSYNTGVHCTSCHCDVAATDRATNESYCPNCEGEPVDTDEERVAMTDGGVDEDEGDDEPVVSSVAARMVDDDGPEDAMEQEDWDALGDETPNPLADGEDEADDDEPVVSAVADRMIEEDGPDDPMEQEDWDALGDETPNPLGGDGEDDDDDERELMTDGGVDEDEGDDEYPADADERLEWTSKGREIVAWARTGTLHVDVEGDDMSFRSSARLTTAQGHDVLDAGHQRDADGERFKALLVADDYADELEALREASEIEPTDEPLTYAVVETTEQRASLDGWGGGERTVTSLEATKSRAEMTDRQTELHRTVDTDSVPEDADVGDELAVDDLLDDPRTSEERDQDALAEAEGTGEEVVIKRYTTGCNDANRECTLDHVSRVATPAGEIETRRTHTY